MRRRVLAVCWAVLILVCLCFSGCDSGPGNGGKITVAVTIVPQETFVRAVCGDLVETVTMVPPGFNPESYEPTAKLMEKFSNASLYFAIGVASEQTYILSNAGNVKTVSLQDEVAKTYPERTFESGERDPHIWLSQTRGGHGSDNRR